MKSGLLRTLLLRKAPLLLLAAGAGFLSGYLLREVWFDEILTLQTARTQHTVSAIYHAYQIPNNHIVFTILLSFWTDLLSSCFDSFPLLLVRLLPAFFAAASLLILFRILRRASGTAAAFFCALTLAVSPAFLIYASALRGYMTGVFLALASFVCARGYLRRGTLPPLLLFGLCSLLAVGTAPTNLAALAGACLLLAPHLAVRKCRLRWAVLFLIPFLTLVLFYYPIRDMFFGCIRLGEGWSSAPEAVWNLYGSALLCFLPILVFAVPGARILFRRKSKIVRLYAVSSALIFLMPLGVYLIFKTPPFPRVFLPLFALWTIPLGFAAGAFLRSMEWKYELALLPLVWGLLLFHASPALSGLLFHDNDDLISPYYVRNTFRPSRTIAFLEEVRRTEPSSVFFLTFGSDYPSLLFAADWPDAADVLLFDVPNRPKRTELPDAPVVGIVASTPEDLEAARIRFGLPGVPFRVENSGHQRTALFRRAAQ